MNDERQFFVYTHARPDGTVFYVGKGRGHGEIQEHAPTQARGQRMMRDPILVEYDEETLSDLLSRWHSWQKSDRGVRGFNRKALVVGDCRPWRLQHEGQLDQIDADIETKTCRQVDYEVRQIDEPHRTAIYTDARNLCSGVAVWNSPRLPSNPAERDVIVKAARALLTQRLRSSGVM